MGGLLSELEQNIEASVALLHHYSQTISTLLSDTERANQDYRNSYDYDWLVKNQLNLRNINLIEWRQSLIEDICSMNDRIERYKNRKAKQEKINSFLQKIYFFLNFNFKTNTPPSNLKNLLKK